MPPPTPHSIEVVEGDITKVRCDAIVNAANAGLSAGGGVCGAIFRAAGHEQLAQACSAIGGCPPGEAVITPAFAITSAKHIIHAVGPIYAAHEPAEARRLLRSAYAAAIRVGARHGCRTLAFPAISTGIYGYPLQEACREAVDVCSEDGRAAGLDILLVAFDAATAGILRRCLATRA